MSRLRNYLHRISIAIKLAAFISLLLLVCVGSFGAISLLLQRTQISATIIREAKRLVSSLESTLRVQMMHGDASLGEAVNRIVRPDGVDSVLLTKHDGTIKYATRQNLVGSKIPLSDFRCTRCHFNGEQKISLEPSQEPFVHFQEKEMIASAIIPTLNAPGCSSSACHIHSSSDKVLGLLQVDVSFKDTAQTLKKYQSTMIILIIGIVATAFLVVFLLIKRWISRPVSELLRGTALVAQGDMTYVVNVAAGELGQLAEAFNKMQKKLRDSQHQILMSEKLASVGKLAAGVAHEINTPLTGILAFAEDLREESKKDDPRQEEYEVIYSEALRCRGIVRNLLDFARQEQPKMVRLRVEEVINRTLRLVSKLPKFHDINIHVDMETDLPDLYGDLGQIQQVFLNMIVNAAEAMPKGGSLSIQGSFDPKTKMICIAFVDNGCGISKEIMDKIFDPFFSTKGGKTDGLGLAVSWGIVEQHGGHIKIDSEVGKGTTFYIYLPPTTSKRHLIETKNNDIQ